MFPSFQGDVRLVELVSLSDPGLVPSAVAGGLSLKLGGDEISAECVARAIGAQRLLLVLDNCEHVIDAAARLAETIVRMCPRTTILATSREILKIEGEQFTAFRRWMYPRSMRNPTIYLVAARCSFSSPRPGPCIRISRQMERTFRQLLQSVGASMASRWPSILRQLASPRSGSSRSPPA